MTDAPQIPGGEFAGMVNLASPHLGTTVAAVSDEFFAPASRMLSPTAPEFKPGVFDAHGKWMDGWETRRRRGGGECDWALIRLGAPGEVLHADMDARHFTGNFPPFAELHGCFSESPPDDSAEWRTLVAKTALRGDSQNIFAARPAGVVNWVRLRIYPDGGIARLRLYGNVRPRWRNLAAGEVAELSALHYGGRIVAYNDAHYGDVYSLLAARDGENMGDGWETRRRREPGNDWIVIALGRAGTLREIVVDTAYFRGNYPEFCSLQGGGADLSAPPEELARAADSWPELLPRQKLKGDTLHRFGAEEIVAHSPVNIVRLNIFPDGGVSRLRIFALPAE
ncbi:MAG: allantoicase [Gammaproteobacteria bacterium]